MIAGKFMLNANNSDQKPKKGKVAAAATALPPSKTLGPGGTRSLPFTFAPWNCKAKLQQHCTCDCCIISFIFTVPALDSAVQVPQADLPGKRFPHYPFFVASRYAQTHSEGSRIKAYFSFLFPSLAFPPDKSSLFMERSGNRAVSAFYTVMEANELAARNLTSGKWPSPDSARKNSSW